MPDKDQIPIIFLAFANDRADRETEGEGYLRNLPEEARCLEAALKKVENEGLCEVEVRSNVTLDQVLDMLQQHRDRLAVFHFGGHANSYRLALETPEGRLDAAHAGGLAAFLGQQTGLQLVFLNGCSTQAQVQGLLDAGVPAVVATSRRIDDAVAVQFSERFYKGMGSGADIGTAYHEAVADIKAREGNAPRGVYRGAMTWGEGGAEVAEDHWPWDLNIRPGAEVVTQWNLPDAAGDPLFGLPPLPEMDLPEDPYRYLEWFRREHARVFFGRGHQIRDLYESVTAQGGEPVILFYGQAGVGKSSLLAAGLLPHLEGSHEVRYVRRNQARGLAGNLQEALDADSGASLSATWLERESGEGKPVVVILDQAEEVFTRPNPDRPDELETFLEALVPIFADSAQRPRGRLIVGFRKEWLAEIKNRFVERHLPHAAVFLQRLDGRGIAEAVAGPARTERLRAKYHLEVDEGLPSLIADALLADPEAPIAPTLQVLLSKMWDQARERDYHAPRFDRELYLSLKRQGILLGDFLAGQLEALRGWRGPVVDSGLALDVLAYHTTRLGTAEEHSNEDLNAEYAHRQDTLPDLLRECRNLYLLVDPAKDRSGKPSTSRLSHDTLAPLVRARFDESDLPGQRARRILESRAVKREDSEEGTPLDEADLKIVEEGLDGMRAWTEPEQKLMDASREKQGKRNRNRRMLWEVTTAAVVLVLIATLAAILQSYEATEQRDAAIEAREIVEEQRLISVRQAAVAKSRELAARSDRVLGDDPELAVLLGIEAIYQTHRSMTDTMTTEASDAIYRALERSRWQQTLQSTLGFGFELAIWNSDDTHLLTAGPDGTQVLDAHTGELLLNLEHGDLTWVRCAAWNTDETRIISAGVGGVSIVWDITSDRGEPGLTLQQEGDVDFAAWCPDDTCIVTASRNGAATVWDSETGGKLRIFEEMEPEPFHPYLFDSGDQRLQMQQLEMSSPVQTGVVGLSPDGLYILIVDQNGLARVMDTGTGEELFTISEEGHSIQYAAWNADNTRLVVFASGDKPKVWDVSQSGPLLISSLDSGSGVKHASWSPDSTRIATCGSDGIARVWNVRTGDELYNVSSGGSAETASWNSDGTRFATAERDGAVKIWDARPYTSIFAPRKDVKGFSSDGSRILTTEADGTGRAWDTKTGSEIFSLEHLHSPVEGARWNPDNTRLLAFYENKTAEIWDVTQDKPLSLFSLERNIKEDVDYVAWSPNGTHILWGDADDTVVQVWDVRSDEPVSFLLEHGGDEVHHAAWGPDGTRIATASQGGTVRVWDVQTRAPVFTATHESEVTYIAWSRDGNRIATASEDPTLTVWDVHSGATILTLPHPAEISHIHWNSDGALILTSSQSGYATVWDSRGGISGFKAPHNTGVVKALWNSNDSHIATADVEGTVTVWDTRSWEPLFSVERGHKIAFLLWNPDDSRLIAIDEDSTASVLFARLDELIDYACSRTGRNMSQDEWSRYMSEQGVYARTCPNLPLDPKLAQQVRTLVMQDNIEDALQVLQTTFERAPDPELPPEQEAQRVLASFLLERGRDRAQWGNVVQATADYTLAQTWNPDLQITAPYWNDLCWYGSLQGFANNADVMEACERAVELDPHYGGIRDSRGLNRALRGDFEGAIEDFQAFVEWSSDEGAKTRRQTWMRALQREETPFTQEVLEGLRQE